MWFITFAYINWYIDAFFLLILICSPTLEKQQKLIFQEIPVTYVVYFQRCNLDKLPEPNKVTLHFSCKVPLSSRILYQFSIRSSFNSDITSFD